MKFPCAIFILFLSFLPIFHCQDDPKEPEDDTSLNSHAKEQPLFKSQQKFYGPADCQHYLETNIPLNVFSPYPKNPYSQINFLKFGDSCDPTAEENFLDELKSAYLKSSSGAQGHAMFRKIWETYRGNSIDGSIGANRKFVAEKSKFANLLNTFAFFRNMQSFPFAWMSS